MLKARSTSGNRELILRVLQRELGEPARYKGLPEFSYVVGGYSLLRSGWISYDGSSEEGSHPVLEKLGFLGLCDYPIKDSISEEDDFAYPISTEKRAIQEGESGGIFLMNLFGMISSWQSIINRALDAHGAFFVADGLMRHVEAHPPVTEEEFLQAIYGWEESYRGVSFSRSYIAMTGFRKGRGEEKQIHQQLADLMIHAARNLNWTKSRPHNVRNKKYVFRTWLNSIGMRGPEYENARRILLSRLPGRTDRRKL